MIFSKKTTLAVLALTAGLILFNGCAKSTQNEAGFDPKDGTAAFIASEVSDMGVSALSSSGLSKTYSAAPETIQVTTTITQWHFDSISKCYIREVVVAYPKGTRTRVDSVYFMGAANDTLGSANLTHPALSDIAAMYHIRHTTKSFLNLDATLRLAMNITFTKTSAETSMVKNGTIVRERSLMNLDQDWNCVVTNVKRYKENGIWEFPSSGNIHVEKTTTNSRNGKEFNRTLDITFLGDSTANVVATRSWDNKKKGMKVDFKTTREGEEGDN